MSRGREREREREREGGREREREMQTDKPIRENATEHVYYYKISYKVQLFTTGKPAMDPTRESHSRTPRHRNETREPLPEALGLSTKQRQRDPSTAEINDGGESTRSQSGSTSSSPKRDICNSRLPSLL